MDSALPVRVLGLSDAVSVVVGGNHTCALLANGTVACWGDNYNNQIGDGISQTGDGTIHLNWTEPFPVAGLSGVSVLSAGQRHTCALVENGAVKCWGDNSMGQLGDGTLGGRVSPVEVNGVTESRFHPLNSEHGALVGGFCLAPALLS